jgi:hypothetical protein
MGSNSSQRLNAYARYDGSGRVVAGSLVLRRSKPKVGNWQPVQGYLCCNVDQTPVLVDVVSSYPITDASIQIGANDGNVFQRMFSYTTLTAANVAALAALFNANSSNLGYFAVVDGDLFVTPSIQLAEFFAANNTTSLYAEAYSN